MTALVLSVAALLISGGALIVATCSVTALRRARRQLRAARLELIVAVQAAADEAAGKDSALRLLEEQRQLRAEEVQTFAAKVDALHATYDERLQQYRAVLAIDGPLASRRLQ